MSSKNVFSYYRDCYKEDSADLNLWDLSKLKKQDRLVLEGRDDLGSGFLPRLPIPQQFAEPMMERVEVYQRERVLLYVRFILVGKLEIKGEVKQVVSPILFNEAVIEKDNDADYYFSLVDSKPDVNESLTQLLMPDVATNFNDDCDIQSAYFWTSFFKQSPVPLSSLPLLNYPELAKWDEIKQALKSDTATLLPASMLVFVERSKSSRGVLHELEEVTESAGLSPPLTALMGDDKVPNEPKALKYDYLPGLLSAAQKKVISIAANADLGCVSGPPGTGKSYTIAAVAAEHMARGESVLIVANNDPALDVIADKLNENFALSEVSIRAGQKAFLKNLKAYIADLLSGYLGDEQEKSPATFEAELKTQNALLNDLESRFNKFCHKAIIRGQRLKKLEDKDIHWLSNLYLKWARRSINKLAKQWSALDHINEQQKNRESLASRYLNALKNNNLRTLVNTQRKSLQAFNQAIRSRTSKRQFELFDNIEYGALLAAFPVWLVSLNSLYRVLPLKQQMFDLVIIDEATQCNISSCLPALYRAKRALVVGDTKQLRHYSFLAKSKETQLRDKNDLSLCSDGVVSYRDNSILDLALTALHSDQQLAFLDEHFRSKPELIHFSNHYFYQSKLKIMQHRPCTSSGHLFLKRVNGKRDKNGVNQLEANAIIAAIKQQINDQKQAGIYQSIGVISPFRSQADFITQQISLHFNGDEIQKHKLRAATPFGFQGEERDIMLISFAVDDDAKRAAVYLNKADVFNVAITRARQKQYLFLSIDETLLPNTSLLRCYIDSITHFSAQHNNASDIDKFQKAVIKVLSNYQIECWGGYAIAGTEVDLLCRYNGRYLAIDLIGYPGPWANFFELDTYKIFSRAHIEILPISYGLWVVNQAMCINEIARRLHIVDNALS